MRTLSIVLLLLISVQLIAQPERKLARSGNELYAKGKFADAEAQYKKALDVKNNMPEALFNLGDAMYRQGRFEDAGKQFQLMSSLDKNAGVKASSYHNLGNSFLEQKEYAKAADAYKKALKINPSDRDTKYNLAYANAKLKGQQQSQQNQNQQNQNQNQENQDKQQQEKGDNKEQQPNKEQEQKDGKQKEEQGDKKEQQQGKQPEKGKFSKEQAERLLQALGKEEEKTQQKMQLQKGEPNEIKILKDW